MLYLYLASSNQLYDLEQVKKFLVTVFSLVDCG